MADSQFCLEWDSHNKNICSGLSSLQQNGEFVDMTLAADGHHVKVHQMVMALASPYIKELITSANCPHPVIFLNNVSYKTLCSILEYIYTGQALVAVDEISELIIAAKQLHVKGLEDVKSVGSTTAVTENPNVDEPPAEMPVIQIKLQRPDTSTPQISILSTLKRKPDTSSVKPLSSMPLRKRTMTMFNKSDTSNKDMPILQKDNDGMEESQDFGFDDPLDVDDRYFNDDDDAEDRTAAVTKPSADSSQTSVQYTVSNQGSVQLILNRFVYSLHYQYRDKSRQWRCLYFRKNKCKASVFTKDNAILRRVGAHNHSFHDKNILRKVRAGAVYSALREAEANTKRPDQRSPSEAGLEIIQAT